METFTDPSTQQVWGRTDPMSQWLLQTMPGLGAGSSTQTYPTEATPQGQVQPLQQGPANSQQAILPILMQLSQIQQAGPRVTQLPTPTNWFGPNTGMPAALPLPGGNGTGGTADMGPLSRMMGLGPWMSSPPSMNPFAGAMTPGALQRIATPLFDRDKTLAGFGAGLGG